MIKTTPELLDQENFERWEKGQPLKKEKQPKMPESKAPVVKDEITLAKLDLEKVAAVLGGHRKAMPNAEGVKFMGFEVTLKMKDGKSVSGWMPASDFRQFRKTLVKKGEISLDKIAL